MRKTFPVLSVVIALVLAVLFVGAFFPVQAQTQIGSGVDLPRASSITFLTPTVITATYNSAPVDLSAYNMLELQYVLDETTTNTTTGILQGSMDGVNWVTTGALFADKTADASELVTPTAMLKWSRLHVTVGNTNPFTLSAYAVSN